MIPEMNGKGTEEVNPLLQKIAMGRISKESQEFMEEICDEALKKNDSRSSKLFNANEMTAEIALQITIERDVIRSLKKRITKIFQSATGG